MITNVTSLIDIDYQRVKINKCVCVCVCVCGGGSKARDKGFLTREGAGAWLGKRGFVRGEGGVQKSNKREVRGIK